MLQFLPHCDQSLFGVLLVTFNGGAELAEFLVDEGEVILEELDALLERAGAPTVRVAVRTPSSLKPMFTVSAAESSTCWVGNSRGSRVDSQPRTRPACTLLNVFVSETSSRNPAGDTTRMRRRL